MYAILLLAQGLTAAATAEGAGKGSPHYWPLGVGLRQGRACSPDIRADRWSPPPLTKRSKRS